MMRVRLRLRMNRRLGSFVMRQMYIDWLNGWRYMQPFKPRSTAHDLPWNRKRRRA